MAGPTPMGISRDGQEGGRKPSFFGGSEVGAAYVLLLPMLVLFGCAVVYPLVETVVLSFTDMRGMAAGKWVGLKNYGTLFADPNFLAALSTTIVWTLVVTALSVGIGWGLAIVCSLAPRATLVFRVMFFAAYGVAETVSGFIWLGIFRPDTSGLVNAVLAGIGLGDWTTAWLGNVSTALWCLMAAYAWTQVGLPLMTCFASIQTIPKTLFEAAYIDGARSTSIMRYIVLPLSMPGLRVAIFINLLNALRAFDMIFVLTGGGPVRSTETIGYFMFRESMLQFKLGYGAAATVVLLVAVVVISIPAIIKRTAEAT